MLIQKHQEAHAAYSSALTSGVLDSKTGYLVRMAAAIALGCYP